jgi:glucosamine--fructose-6-phosphate aminotransferase (isomerizing)
MCGIVGYVGRKESLQVLVDSLARLAYRGYDSAGIAFQNGNGLEIYKTQGRIHDLQQILPIPIPSIRIGIGHTRWATHGAPSTANAHPHSVGGVTVVHNGIIENHRALRKSLEAEGTTFLSQTDSEVIPHLIDRHLQRGLPIVDAILKTIADLRGSYALAILHEGTPDRIFAVRSGSPLVLGISDHGHCVRCARHPAVYPEVCVPRGRASGGPPGGRD